MSVSVSPLAKSILILGIVGLSGCSAMFGDNGVFRGKSKDYLKTDTLDTISLPEGMTSRSLEPLYAIPEVNPRDEFGDALALGDYAVPRPVPVNTEKGSVGVKMQKLGDRKWIFLNASTAQVWPRTQNFFSEMGIQVLSSNPSTGLIETGNVVFKDTPDQKSRYRIFIEKGVHPETTEIHVVQADVAQDKAMEPEIEWPKVSDNLELERQLLDELGGVLAENVNNNSASLLGQNVGGDLKVEFLRNSAEPTMRIRLAQARARATVAHALTKEGFVLWEEALDKKIFYVGFNPEASEDAGFLQRLWRDDLPEKAPYTVAQLLQHLAPEAQVKTKFADTDGVAFGEALRKTIGLFVHIDSRADASDVIIRDARGRLIPASEAKQLLRIIRKNLI